MIVNQSINLTFHESPTTAMNENDENIILSESFVMSSNICMCIGEINEKDYPPTYAMYNFIVIIIMLPIVAVFGLISNVVNIYIFTRPRMVSSANVYLTALACSDFMVVVTGLFIFCLDSIRGYLPEITFFATKSILYMLPIGYMAQTGSVYFTVGAAIDCYVSLCWEPFSRDYCTVRRAKQYVFSVVLFTLGYNVNRFWQYFLHECYYRDEFTIEFCTTALYHRLNIVYNVYMYMILMTLLPFILLSILNALIVRNVKKHKQQTQKDLIIKNNYQQKNHHAYQLCPTATPTAVETKTMMSMSNSMSSTNVVTDDDNVGGVGGGDADGNNGDDTVITMVMVVIMFLVCNILALVINVVETFFKPGRLLLNYLSDTSNFLVVFNSSVNFVIYILFDGQYRKVLVARIRPCPHTIVVADGGVSHHNHRGSLKWPNHNEIRTESTLQTLVSNDGCETAL